MTFTICKQEGSTFYHVYSVFDTLYTQLVAFLRSGLISILNDSLLCSTYRHGPFGASKLHTFSRDTVRSSLTNHLFNASHYCRSFFVRSSTGLMLPHLNKVESSFEPVPNSPIGRSLCPCRMASLQLYGVFCKIRF